MIKPQDILVLVKLISIENQHQIFKEYYSEAQLEWDKLEDEQLDNFLDSKEKFIQKEKGDK
mgnify:CR=1 FL=1